MTIFPIAVLVLLLLVATIRRGVPDMNAADEAVERAKAAAGQAGSFGAWDLGAVLLKIVLWFLIVAVVGMTLIGIGLAVA